MKAFQAIYRFWVTILTAAVVIQIFLAGYGAFDAAGKLEDEGSSIDEESFHNGFEPHIALGYLIFLGTLVLLLLSFGARGRGRILRSLGVVGLAALQVVLAWIGYERPVCRRWAAPDQRVHHPRLSRLDHLPRVEGRADGGHRGRSAASCRLATPDGCGQRRRPGTASSRRRT